MTLYRRVTAAGIFVLLLTGGAGVAHSQEGTGRIVGRVIDASTGQPISSAQVAVPATDRMVLSDLDGRFHIAGVPSGVHEVRTAVIGYAPKVVTDVTVTAGRTTSLNVGLDATAIEVEAIRVTATLERGATAALLDRQKNAVAVTDAVGEQEISRSPDSDAAEVARRVSGVTVSEGKYVYIRGLGERYSQTSLNGVPLPSPEPEKEVVPLDLFPADFIESLTTQKTYTPDLPGDFSGGSVDISNKEFPASFTWRLSLGSSVNTESQFDGDFLTYNGGDLDFLGIDDGTREIPGAVRDEGFGLEGNRLPTDPATVQRLGEAFAAELPQFAPTTRTTPANLDIGGSIGHRTSLFGKDFGYFVAGSYDSRNTFRTDEVERKWRAEAFDPELPPEFRSPNVNYAFDRATRSVTWGGVANFSLLLSPEHQLNLKTMYNRNSDDESRTYTGANQEDLGANVFSERLRFESRYLAWGQLGGEHQLPLLDSRLDWKFTLARAERSEPGLRETIYAKPFGAPESEPFLLEDVGESGRYFYSELTDDDINGALDWRLPLGVWGNGEASLKVGGAARLKERDFAARRYRWRFLSQTIPSLDDVIAAGRIVGFVDEPGEVALQDIFEPGDRYGAEDTRLAGYLMFDLPLTSRLRTVFGARMENYELDLGTAQGDSASLDETDVLPALNLTYALNEAMNLRLAGSRTLDRPEFRELAPFQFTEASSLRQLFGNPDLQVAEIWSGDLRWEWFPRPGEVLAVSGFYKRLDQPIEQVFIATASSAYSFQNADDGDLYGAELTFRKRLDFMGGVGDRFTAGGNLAVIDSEVRVTAEGIFNPTSETRRLEGQSPFVVNLSLGYLSPEGATELGAFYNVYGARIAAAGGSGVPDIEERPRHQVDLTWKQRLLPRLRLKLKAENLLDEPYRWEQSANGITEVQRQYTVGRTFAIGLTYGN